MMLQNGHYRMVTAAAWGAKGGILATAAEDDTVKVWRRDGILLHTFRLHGMGVWSLAVHPDGNVIAAGSVSGTVTLLGADGTLINSFTAHFQPVSAATWRPDGNILATASSDRTIRLWDRSGTKKLTLTGHLQKIEGLAYSPDGELLASVSHDGTVRLWNRDGAQVGMVQIGTPAYNISWTADGSRFAVSCADNTARIFRRDGTPAGILRGHQGSVFSVAWSPDASMLATASWDRTIRTWNAAGRPAGKTVMPGEGCHTALFSPDGGIIAAASGASDIYLLNRDGTIIKKLQGAAHVPKHVAFIERGNRLAVGAASGSVLVRRLDGSVEKSVPGGGGGFEAVIGPENILPLRRLGHYQNFHYRGKAAIPSGAFGEFFSSKERDANNVYHCALSPDGSILATAPEYQSYPGDPRKILDLDFSISLWRRDGGLAGKLRGHEGNILDLAWHPDGKVLVSASSDNTVRLWNTGSDASAILSAFTSGDWLIHTPDGYWDGSRESGEFLAMVKGTGAWSVDQFALRFNRPDIILERLGIAGADEIAHYRSRYLRRLRRAGLGESDVTGDLRVPEAAITESRRNGDNLTLSFTLKDDTGGLSAYRLFVNDVPLFGPRGKEVTGHTASLTETVTLSSGMNKVELSCVNRRGAESFRVKTYEEQKTRVKGDLYFLGFGVSDYRREDLRLTYAHKDARDLAGVFAKMKRDYNKVHVRTYLDGEVTVDSIRKGKEFFTGAGVNDTVVLFVAGHGQYDRTGEATYYYLPHDADPGNLAATGADFDLIEDLLHGIAPRKKLFLLDTCESGEIDDDDASVKSAFRRAEGMGVRARKSRGLSVLRVKKRDYLHARDRYIYNDLVRRSGAVVFSSSLGGEYSYESSRYGNGLFTAELLRGLSGKADTDRNGAITMGELRDYVGDAVTKASEGLQHPTVDRDNIYVRIAFPPAR
jgi:WD40 repeat protein